ncbi:MAG: iron ABC transporter permease [Caldilinea sp.]|nr:iron ABC transporter permease [Caldilinea sp.]MDW8440509.1 iron ABC transporter permease [Caldilineaceae bacterium]
MSQPEVSWDSPATATFLHIEGEQRPGAATRRWVFVGLVGVLLIVFLLSISLGSVAIPLGDIGRVLLGGEAQKATWTTIVFHFRLPKALTAMLAGAALAVSGLQMQTLFRNPLAGPFVLGVSSGASLGVALVVLGVGAGSTSLLAGLGLLGNFGIAAAASIGAGAVMMAVLVLARRGHSSMTLLILGMLFGYATGGLVSILLYFAIGERIQSYLLWTFGSFGKVTWGQMAVFAPTILFALLIGVLMAKPLNALLLGEAYARSMGLNVNRARIGIVVSASVLAGVVTAFCGPIAFLGVAVPHLCRSLFNTSDHRLLLPGVSLLGAVLALLTDLIAHVPGSSITLPLNAVTSLVGAPVVAWVILRRRNLRQAFAG